MRTVEQLMSSRFRRSNIRLHVQCPWSQDITYKMVSSSLVPFFYPRYSLCVCLCLCFALPPPHPSPSLPPSLSIWVFLSLPLSLSHTHTYSSPSVSLFASSTAYASLSRHLHLYLFVTGLKMFVWQCLMPSWPQAVYSNLFNNRSDFI